MSGLDQQNPTIPAGSAAGRATPGAAPEVVSEAVRPPRLSAAGWARWAWRTLTSMRTALVLLGLLALAAVPGSLLPQRGVSSDPAAVARFSQENPLVSAWLDRLRFFEVYSAPWFAAIYLLLLTSMTGCVLPRCARLWRSARAEPPRAPEVLARLPGYQHWTATSPSHELLAAAAGHMRRHRFRVIVRGDEVRAEKGYLREVGNLVFHLSLLVLLFGVAAGKLYGFEGTVIVAEGAGFTNVRAQYDSFTGGPLLDEAALAPFSLTLTDFDATFEPVGPQRGTPRKFTADVKVRSGLNRSTRAARIQVNHPLVVNGTKVFLTGNGYAPRVTVRDGRRQVVFSGTVVFLPTDGNLTSDGVVKAPDAQPAQLAFEGVFLPTAQLGPQGPFSAFPDTLNPRLLITAYTGDLGLGNGVPQSVYSLDKTSLTQVQVDRRPLARALRVGDTMILPDGLGSITLDGVARFANFQLARDPGKEISLVAAVLLLAGLSMSLGIRRRRIWVRVSPAPAPYLPSEPGLGRVEVAALGLTRRGAAEQEVAELADVLRITTTAITGPPELTTAAPAQAATIKE